MTMQRLSEQVALAWATFDSATGRFCRVTPAAPILFFIETDTLDEAIAELQTLKDVLDGTRPPTAADPSLLQVMASVSLSITVGPVTVTITVRT